ncbi:MAG: hypothetical protein LBG96_12025 [Tannerella sp.]|jgi:hypothetical protein|nr:hypothetical protein [Tannerella sp.]
MERIEISQKKFIENPENYFNMVEKGTLVVLKRGKARILIMSEEDDADREASKQVSPYKKEYVDIIKQAEEDIKSGKGKTMTIEDLWK